MKDLLVARFGKVPKTGSLKLEKAAGRLLRRDARRIITAKRERRVRLTVSAPRACRTARP